LVPSSARSVPFDITSTPSEASRRRGERPRIAADEVVGLEPLSAKSILFEIVSIPSEESRLNAETPPLRATEEDIFLASFSVKLMHSEITLLASDATLRRGDIARNAACEDDGLSCLPAIFVPFDIVSTPSDANGVLCVTRDAAEEVDGLLDLSAKSMPFDTALIPSEASLLRGDIPRDVDDEVDGRLSFLEKSVFLDIVSTPSEASLLLGETPRDETDEPTALLSFSAKSMFFTMTLIPSDASRLLGEIPLDEADGEAGFLSFSGKSTFFRDPEVDVLLGESPLDENGVEMGPLSLSEDFAVVCDVALDTLDTDVLGEILDDETDNESALLCFSVGSMLSDMVLVSDSDKTLRDASAKAVGLTSLPEFVTKPFVMHMPLEEGDLFGDSPLDETEVETNRSILSARSMLLDKASAAEDAVVLFGETPRDGRTDLLILSAGSMLLDIALAETLSPIIAGQRCWSITFACGFSN
jgi:hypothetical protein